MSSFTFLATSTRKASRVKTKFADAFGGAGFPARNRRDLRQSMNSGFGQSCAAITC